MNTKTAILSIDDLTPDTAAELSKTLREVAGVTEVDFSLERKVVVVEFDPEAASVDGLTRVVLSNGYKVL